MCRHLDNGLRCSVKVNGQMYCIWDVFICKTNIHVMKPVMINAYEVALIFEKHRLIRVLTEGRYWMKFTQIIQRFSMTEPLAVDFEWAIITKRPSVNDLLETILIREGELGLEFKDGVFRKLLSPGRYGYWRSPVEYKVEIVNLHASKIPDSVCKRLLTRPELKRKIHRYEVKSYETGLLFVNSKFQRTLDPGTHYYWKPVPTTSVTKVDMRTQLMKVDQKIVTEDNEGLRVYFQAVYQVIDAEKAILKSKDFRKELYALIQWALNKCFIAVALKDISKGVEKAEKRVLKLNKEAMQRLGIQMVSGGISEIIRLDMVSSLTTQQKKAGVGAFVKKERTTVSRGLSNRTHLVNHTGASFKLRKMEFAEKTASRAKKMDGGSDTEMCDESGDIFSPERA